jgi:integrase
MARPVQFKPVKTKKMGWRLNVPSGYTETGKREQLFFPTREKALEAARRYKDKQTKFGTQAKSIKPILADAATRAAEILKPYGITILEAAERVVEMELKARKSRPISEALLAFMETKTKRSHRRQQEIRYVAETLTDAFGDRILSGITGEEIAKAIEEKYPANSTFNSRIEDCARFLRWAAKKPRTWADASEVESFEKKDHKKSKTVVMTPRDAEALLRTAEDHFPDSVPAFVLMLFMGVRPSEVTKMSGSDITEDGVTIPDEDEETGDETKTGRRFIQMTPVVSEWLKAYPVEKRITPANWSRKWDAVRRRAGWAVVAELLEGDEWNLSPKLKKWVPDILRHTAATIAINSGKPMSTLIFEHGHTQGEATLKKHYLGRMTEKQSLAILSIGPKGKKLKTIQAA